ncbi:unnamed protein product [Protopolystoma xenopodis]|uniref:Uncharacterized protein n=1 Tax=Protopolystoma xenopodis TaxID=117903 RepID=A0A448XB83_9PLAT|nr:unnamed protein product [Protopolystoma xenopodis]
MDEDGLQEINLESSSVESGDKIPRFSFGKNRLMSGRQAFWTENRPNSAEELNINEHSFFCKSSSLTSTSSSTSTYSSEDSPHLHRSIYHSQMPSDRRNHASTCRDNLSERLSWRNHTRRHRQRRGSRPHYEMSCARLGLAKMHNGSRFVEIPMPATAFKSEDIDTQLKERRITERTEVPVLQDLYLRQPDLWGMVLAPGAGRLLDGVGAESLSDSEPEHFMEAPKTIVRPIGMEAKSSFVFRGELDIAERKWNSLPSGRFRSERHSKQTNSIFEPCIQTYEGEDYEEDNNDNNGEKLGERHVAQHRGNKVGPGAVSSIPGPGPCGLTPACRARMTTNLVALEAQYQRQLSRQRGASLLLHSPLMTGPDGLPSGPALMMPAVRPARKERLPTTRASKRVGSTTAGSTSAATDLDSNSVGVGISSNEIVGANAGKSKPLGGISTIASGQIVVTGSRQTGPCTKPNRPAGRTSRSGICRLDGEMMPLTQIPVSVVSQPMLAKKQKGFSFNRALARPNSRKTESFDSTERHTDYTLLASPPIDASERHWIYDSCLVQHVTDRLYPHCITDVMLAADAVTEQRSSKVNREPKPLTSLLALIRNNLGAEGGTHEGPSYFSDSEAPQKAIKKRYSFQPDSLYLHFPHQSASCLVHLKSNSGQLRSGPASPSTILPEVTSAPLFASVPATPVKFPTSESRSSSLHAAGQHYVIPSIDICTDKHAKSTTDSENLICQASLLQSLEGKCSIFEYTSEGNPDQPFIPLYLANPGIEQLHKENAEQSDSAGAEGEQGAGVIQTYPKKCPKESVLLAGKIAWPGGHDGRPEGQKAAEIWDKEDNIEREQATCAANKITLANGEHDKPAVTDPGRMEVNIAGDKICIGIGLLADLC